MPLNQLISIFIVSGFFVILTVPFMRLLYKAGMLKWLAFIPGANLYAFVRLTQRGLGYVSVLSLLAGIVFLILHGIINFSGGFIEYLGAIFSIILGLWLLSQTIPFPLLSCSLFLLVAMLSPYGGFELLGAIFLLGLGLLQLLVDFFLWQSLLTKLKKPIWQIVFIVLPAFVLFLNTLLAILGEGLPRAFLAATLIPSLFISLVYYYYLGYSPKVTYRARA